MPLANKGVQMLQQFGNNQNTQLFADNISGTIWLWLWGRRLSIKM